MEGSGSIPARVEAVLRELLDVARATAAARLDRESEPDAPIRPFALVHAGGDVIPVGIDDVAAHLGTAAGTGRVAHSLLDQFRADGFAIGAPGRSSPTGDPTHPQSREVVRVIVGHREGLSGAAFCEVRRGPEGPRLAGVWETSSEEPGRLPLGGAGA